MIGSDLPEMLMISKWRDDWPIESSDSICDFDETVAFKLQPAPKPWLSGFGLPADRPRPSADAEKAGSSENHNIQNVGTWCY